MLERIAAVCGLSFLLSTSAFAATTTFTATLTGSQERPTPVGTEGFGIGSAVYDDATNMLTIHVEFHTLNSNAQDAHIHCCATTETNAGVALGFTTAGFPFGVTAGVYDHVFDMGSTSIYTSGFLTGNGGTANGARDALLFAMGATSASSRAYFNIHTMTSPGGEIRGNIVPEPGTALLLFSGLTAIAYRRRAR